MLMALMLIVLAGGMNGSFAAPMKYVRSWKWEHTWLAWSFFAMLVFPLIIAAATNPNLLKVYSAVPSSALIVTALYGVIWGIGTVLFGLAISRIGLALSFGIVLGTSSSLGALVPLLVLHRNQVFTSTSLCVFAGAGVILAGIAATARAGVLREAAAGRSGKGSSALAVFLCLLSGVGSSSMNLALNASVPITSAAESLGTPQGASLNAVWPVLLAGGFAVNAIYCILLLFRHENVALYRAALGTNIALSVGMALLWSGSNVIYGFGAHAMGSLGLVLGWPVYMASIVMAANVWGAATGEWKGAGQRAMTWAVAGCLLLLAGIWIVASAANRS